MHTRETQYSNNSFKIKNLIKLKIMMKLKQNGEL